MSNDYAAHLKLIWNNIECQLNWNNLLINLKNISKLYLYCTHFLHFHGNPHLLVQVMGILTTTNQMHRTSWLISSLMYCDFSVAVRMSSVSCKSDNVTPPPNTLQGVPAAVGMKSSLDSMPNKVLQIWLLLVSSNLSPFSMLLNR